MKLGHNIVGTYLNMSTDLTAVYEIMYGENKYKSNENRFSLNTSLSIDIQPISLSPNTAHVFPSQSSPKFFSQQWCRVFLRAVDHAQKSWCKVGKWPDKFEDRDLLNSCNLRGVTNDIQQINESNNLNSPVSIMYYCRFGPSCLTSAHQDVPTSDCISIHTTTPKPSQQEAIELLRLIQDI